MQRPELSKDNVIGGCPESLIKLTKKCWDGDPEKRPTMDEVIKVLLEAADEIVR